MTFQPSCVITWASQCAGADDQLRTVETVLAELNAAKATLAEIEAIEPPHCEAIQMRAFTARYIADRAVREAQAIADMRVAIKRAAE